MDLRYAREATVGTLVLVAIAIFIGGTMWLSGRSLGGGDGVRIRFAHIGLLKRASPVRISGVIVGKVESIELVNVGNVIVTVSLPPQIVPKVDASAKVVAVGLAGDAALDFNPGTAPTPLPEGAVIPGTQEEALSDVATQLSDRADSVLLGAQAIMNEETATQLRATLGALQRTLGTAERTMALYGDAQRGPSAELTRTMASFREVTARLDRTLADPAVARTLQRMDTLTGNLNVMTQRFAGTSERLDSLLSRIDRGEGTFGKLATDSSLYSDFRDLTRSMRELTDEIKRNPGKIGVTVKLF